MKKIDIRYANSPLSLFQERPIEEIKNVRWYFDCGEDDLLYKENSAMHIILRDLNIPHEFIIRYGDHTWEYWRKGITDGLKFIGTGFRR